MFEQVELAIVLILCELALRYYKKGECVVFLEAMKKFYDTIFLTYEKILTRLKILGVTTKSGKEITYTDLKKAINVMLEKHPSCRWRSQRIKNRKYLILIEGYYWLRFVYFQKEKSLVDADIEFFENRIKQYEKLLKVDFNKKWWCEDMDVEQLEIYFDKKESSIRKSIKKMCDNGFEKYNSYVDGKVVIFSNGVEWICKNIFKDKYLQLLEECKMELTELYIEKGYHYDEFFAKN